jgi:glycopeptide antibiotics resistance protein
MFRFIQHLFSRQIFWLYTGIVILLIVLPINTSGSRFNLNHIMVVKIRGDYFAHALIFLPWAFFGPVMRKNTIFWLLLGLLFSTGTEMLQFLLPYRRFNINDLISNSIGIVIGILILILISKITTPKTTENEDLSQE